MNRYIDSATQIGSCWVECVIECTSCNGSGKYYDINSLLDGTDCKTCRGSGKTVKSVSLGYALRSLMRKNLIVDITFNIEE